MHAGLTVPYHKLEMLLPHTKKSTHIRLFAHSPQEDNIEILSCFPDSLHFPVHYCRCPWADDGNKFLHAHKMRLTFPGSELWFALLMALHMKSAERMPWALPLYDLSISTLKTHTGNHTIRFVVNPVQHSFYPFEYSNVQFLSSMKKLSIFTIDIQIVFRCFDRFWQTLQGI